MFEILVPSRIDADRWFPVDAVSLPGNVFRITSVPETAPRLLFGPGDRVVCEQQTGQDGHIRWYARRMAPVAQPW